MRSLRKLGLGPNQYQSTANSRRRQRDYAIRAGRSKSPLQVHHHSAGRKRLRLHADVANERLAAEHDSSPTGRGVIAVWREAKLLYSQPTSVVALRYAHVSPRQPVASHREHVQPVDCWSLR